jgi:hypothetical protein
MLDENVKGREHLTELAIDGQVVLKLKAQTGINWLKMMYLQVP